MRMQTAGVAQAEYYQEEFGAMTDASKRRKPGFESDLEEEFEHVGPVEHSKSEKPKPSTSVPASGATLYVPVVNVGNAGFLPTIRTLRIGALQCVNSRKFLQWSSPMLN